MKTESSDPPSTTNRAPESQGSNLDAGTATLSGVAEPTPPPAVTTTVSPVRKANHRHRRRRWLPYVGALALIALLVAGFWPEPIPVETARATLGVLRATVNEEGKTRIKQRYVVSAPVAGQLRRIPFKAGAEVTAGETVLAVIEPLAPAPLDARTRALAEARRDTAAANLERARAARQFAASELARVAKLAKEQTVSDQEFDTAQWRDTAAAKELAAAEGALRQAEAELAAFPSGAATPALTEVRAPTSGRVLRVIEESARAIAAGAPLVEIGDPADLEVVIEVLSRDGAAMAPGTKVELDQWGGGPPLEARLRLVEPAAFTKVSALGVEEQRVNAIADLLTPFEQRRGLGDNFRVEARILVWESDRTLKVPAGALFRRGQEWSAFVVRNGRAELRAVRVGRSSGTEMQVLDGLQEGEELIVYPGDRIREGQRVKPTTI